MSEYKSSLSDNATKEEIRYRLNLAGMLMHVENTKQYVLSLPGPNIDLEKNWIRQGYIVHAVEEKLEVYKEQQRLKDNWSKHHKTGKLKLHHADLIDFLRREPRIHYRIIYADLCMTGSNADYLLMLAALKGRCDKLFITFCLTRNSREDFKKAGYKGMIKLHTQDLLRVNYKVVHPEWYINGRSNMCTFECDPIMSKSIKFYEKALQ